MKYKVLINYLLFKHREGSWNITVQVQLGEGLESEVSRYLSRGFSLLKLGAELVDDRVRAASDGERVVSVARIELSHRGSIMGLAGSTWVASLGFEPQCAYAHTCDRKMW